jgi:hypothetical protein
MTAIIYAYGLRIQALFAGNYRDLPPGADIAPPAEP